MERLGLHHRMTRNCYRMYKSNPIQFSDEYFLGRSVGLFINNKMIIYSKELTIRHQ